MGACYTTEKNQKVGNEENNNKSGSNETEINQNKGNDNKTERIDHKNLNNGGAVESSKIDISKKAICKIFKIDTNEYATGFFMGIYSSFNCLLTNYKIIPQNMVDSNSIIEISNSEMKKQLKLDKNERYIKCFEKYDITLIEIKKSDKIDQYFKPFIFDLNYQILPTKLKSDSKEIYLLHYPKSEDLHLSIGNITKISHFEFEHTASTENGSLGCPIILTNNNKVIGINKQGKNITENYGTFLGVIFEDINKDIKQGLLNINVNINLTNNIPLQKENDDNNIITADIYIDEKNINKDVLIINSYEEFMRRSQNSEYDEELKNEKEIKKCEITIEIEEKINNEENNGENNGENKKENIEENNKENKEENIEENNKENKEENKEEIKEDKKTDKNKMKNFSYTYNFKQKGIYKITYEFKSNLKNLSCLFNGCSLLTNIDLSKFDSSNVKYMRMMFYECSSLKNINFSNCNTDNVIDMGFMFTFCSSLCMLNLSDFNTDKVDDMSGMFSFCSSLRDLDISSFNTENVIYMESMFSCCDLLEELNLSHFKTAKVTNMDIMFSKCTKLKKLNLKSFDTKNVTSMKGMFLFCNSLEELDLSNFNTKKVTDMSEMFFLCTSLKYLDLTNFEIINVKNFNKIFYGCVSLKKDKLGQLKKYVLVSSGDLNMNSHINVKESNSEDEDFNLNLKESYVDLMINNERELFFNLLIQNIMNNEHIRRHQIEFFFIPNIIADLYSKKKINDDIIMNPSSWKKYEPSPGMIDPRFLENISIQKKNLNNEVTKFILIFPQPKYGTECFFAILYFDKNKESSYYTLELELGNDFGSPEGSGLVCGQKGDQHINYNTICRANLEDFQNIAKQLYKEN